MPLTVELLPNNRPDAKCPACGSSPEHQPTLSSETQALPFPPLSLFHCLPACTHTCACMACSACQLADAARWRCTVGLVGAPSSSTVASVQHCTRTCRHGQKIPRVNRTFLGREMGAPLLPRVGLLSYDSVFQACVSRTQTHNPKDSCHRMPLSPAAAETGHPLQETSLLVPPCRAIQPAPPWVHAGKSVLETLCPESR